MVGMWKAFEEMERIGWKTSSARPKMVSVQAENCAPIVRAFEQGAERSEMWQNASTVADGLRVPKAIGDFLVLRAVRESGGTAIAVEEQDILQAVEDVARDDGMLFCPEGGAVLAGWRHALQRGLVARNESVLLFNCANGNKYPLPNRSKMLKLAEAQASGL